MLASAVLVLGIVVMSIVFIFQQAHPRQQIDRDAAGISRVYVDPLDVLQALIIIGIGAVIFAGLVSWFIARRAVRPLGEVLRLQREFVADASHELRTPLAVLDARIQVFERRLNGPKPPGTSESALKVAELRADSRALVDIVNDLLLAAGRDSRQDDPITAGPVIVTAVDSLRILATDRGVGLSVDVDDQARIRIPVAGLRRCVVALVDNAISHSPRGSTVSVTATDTGHLLRLAVVDHGSGIQGIATEKVFDRFAHSTIATEQERPSFGIGLALVREIATRQGGRVRVEQTSKDGTTMALELPLAK